MNPFARDVHAECNISVHYNKKKVHKAGGRAGYAD